MALYCPQGSGTLRQQLLMMHDIAWWWWWVSSRSGWLLELLTELKIKLEAVFNFGNTCIIIPCIELGRCRWSCIHGGTLNRLWMAQQIPNFPQKSKPSFLSAISSARWLFYSYYRARVRSLATLFSN